MEASVTSGLEVGVGGTEASVGRISRSGGSIATVDTGGDGGETEREC
jgi:hypothetical protein